MCIRWGTGLALMLAAVLGLAAARPAAAVLAYTVTDLGSLEQGYVGAVNDSGQAVGVHREYVSGTPTWPGFIIDNGTLHYLPDLGHPVLHAEDINDSSLVVGSAILPGETAERAVVWSDEDHDGVPDTIHNLGPLLDGNWDYAYGVNSAGHVAGAADNADGDNRAFLWKDTNGNFAVDAGELTDLGVLSTEDYSESEAYAVNDLDVVVGYATDDDGAYNAFAWSEATGMVGLGIGNAKDINAAGTTVGSTSGNQPYMWTDTDSDGVPDLGAAVPMFADGQWGFAHGINDAGLIVGHQRIGGDVNATHAFLYDGSQLQDLNDLIPAGSGWTLNSAYDISNSGYIVGQGNLEGGSPHLYRLDPVPDVIPEPCTLALLGTGAIGLLIRRRRR